MAQPPRSSRHRYLEFRKKDRAKKTKHKRPVRTDGTAPADDRDNRTTHRARKFSELFGAFWRMVRAYRAMLLLSLVTASVSTLLGIAPLYGTKLVVDNVLGGKPLP